MRSALALGALLVLAAACGGEPVDPLEVVTEAGTIRGRPDGATRAFRGIPYAAPPVGEHRFRPPQPVAHWDGARDATDVGPMCPQNFGFAPGGGDEDCLYLNVWTPAPAPATPAPVMVWFHGGAFVFGSGGEPYYGGAKLAESRGVVVVTVNYRLGPFGFLAHPDLAAEDPAHPSSGNYGLEDQLAALEWVQRNIAAFGGDPARVTIFGESAGGFSACVHYLSPRSRGLFHAVISQSGVCGSDIIERSRAEAEAAGVAFAEEVGCAGPGALACLRGRSFWDLLDAAAGAPLAEQHPGGILFQGPGALEWAANVDGDLLPATTGEAFAAGGYPPLPLLLGSNRDEGTFFLWRVLAREVADEAEYRAALARRFGADQVDAIAARYPVATFASPNAALAAVAGDALMTCPARRTARAAAAAGAPVYLYAFERELEQPLVPDGGVVHSGEIPFVFGIDEYPLGKVGEAGRPLVEAIQDYWTGFAADGDPNGGVEMEWPRYEEAGDRHLVLDVPITASSAHRRVLCDFWDGLAD